MIGQPDSLLLRDNAHPLTLPFPFSHHSIHQPGRYICSPGRCWSNCALADLDTRDCLVTPTRRPTIVDTTIVHIHSIDFWLLRGDLRVVGRVA